MPLVFYPHSDDLNKGSLENRIDILMEGAERFKAVILDSSETETEPDANKRLTPRDLKAAYNWEELARILREIRDLPEGNKPEKNTKGILLVKLAEVYEVLRSAKMSKLEAVRLALINEAHQLRGSSSQVA